MTTRRRRGDDDDLIGSVRATTGACAAVRRACTIDSSPTPKLTLHPYP